MRKKETRKSRLFLRAVLRVIMRMFQPYFDTLRYRGDIIPKDPHVYIIWHEELLAAIEYLRDTDTVVMVSGNHVGQSMDGSLKRLGYHVVFGSTRHGGMAAMRTLIRSVRDQPRNILITVDGSRGPRRVMKPGACMIASRTGFSIRLLRFRCWGLRFPTWDRMLFPLPFAGVQVSAETVPVPTDASGAGKLSEFVAHCEARLNALQP